jgi:hypothetical protein
MTKYVSMITIITAIALFLFATDKITLTLFLVVFIPSGIYMLVIGIVELKNTIKNKEDIHSKAKELKNRKK